MAAWQFDLYFILGNSSLSDSSVNEGHTPLLPLSLIFVIQESLAHYFGPPWRMLEDWLVFGPENGNRIDIFFEDDDCGNVFVRCDARIEAPQFLLLVSDLARFHGCNLFSAQHRTVIQPDLQALQRALDRSGVCIVPGRPFGG